MILSSLIKPDSVIPKDISLYDFIEDRWVGVQRINGVWVWPDGSAVDENQFYKEVLPILSVNSCIAGDCAIFDWEVEHVENEEGESRREETITWIIERCDLKKRYICEYEGELMLIKLFKRKCEIVLS